jgi:hypothetical protein
VRKAAPTSSGRANECPFGIKPVSESGMISSLAHPMS